MIFVLILRRIAAIDPLEAKWSSLRSNCPKLVLRELLAPASRPYAINANCLDETWCWGINRGKRWSKGRCLLIFSACKVCSDPTSLSVVMQLLFTALFPLECQYACVSTVVPPYSVNAYLKAVKCWRIQCGWTLWLTFINVDDSSSGDLPRWCMHQRVHAVIPWLSVISDAFATFTSDQSDTYWPDIDPEAIEEHPFIRSPNGLICCSQIKMADETDLWI